MEPSPSPQAAKRPSGLSESVCGMPSSTNCSTAPVSTRSTNSAPLPAATSSSRPRKHRCDKGTACPVMVRSSAPSAPNTSTSLPLATAICWPSARQHTPAGQRAERCRTRATGAASFMSKIRRAPSWLVTASPAPRGCQASSSTPGQPSSSSCTAPSSTDTRCRRPSPPPTTSQRPSGENASATGKSSRRALAPGRSTTASLLMPGRPRSRRAVPRDRACGR